MINYINCTLIIQIINFWITYFILRSLIFDPVLELINDKQDMKNSMLVALTEKEKAIETAEKTLDLFSDSTRKADAARLIGNIYNELGQNEAAIAYYQKSDSIDPHHYLTTKNLLIQYLKIHHPQLDLTREAFFLLGPKNPTIYLDLSAIYIAENQTRNLIDFFEDQIGNFRNDIRVRANLYYYSGNLYLEFDEEKAAKNLTKARKLFAKFVPEGNRIFEMIDRTLYKL